MERKTKIKIFKIAALLFLAAVLYVFVDIMRKTNPPGTKKKWGVEAIKEGRDTFKRQLRYKPQIEQRIGSKDSLEAEKQP